MTLRFTFINYCHTFEKRVNEIDNTKDWINQVSWLIKRISVIEMYIILFQHSASVLTMNKRTCKTSFMICIKYNIRARIFDLYPHFITLRHFHKHLGTRTMTPPWSRCRNLTSKKPLSIVHKGGNWWFPIEGTRQLGKSIKSSHRCSKFASWVTITGPIVVFDCLKDDNLWLWEGVLLYTNGEKHDHCCKQ